MWISFIFFSRFGLASGNFKLQLHCIVIEYLMCPLLTFMEVRKKKETQKKKTHKKEKKKKPLTVPFEPCRPSSFTDYVCLHIFLWKPTAVHVVKFPLAAQCLKVAGDCFDSYCLSFQISHIFFWFFLQICRTRLRLQTEVRLLLSVGKERRLPVNLATALHFC